MTIGNYKQQIVYEEEKILCKICGCLGHVATSCPEKREALTPVNPSYPAIPPLVVDLKEEWQTVSFTRKRSGKKSSVTPVSPASYDWGKGDLMSTPGKFPNSLPSNATTLTNGGKDFGLGYPHSIGPPRVDLISKTPHTHLGQPNSFPIVKAPGPIIISTISNISSHLSLNLRPSIALGPITTPLEPVPNSKSILYTFLPFFLILTMSLHLLIMKKKYNFFLGLTSLVKWLLLSSLVILHPRCQSLSLPKYIW